MDGKCVTKRHRQKCNQKNTYIAICAKTVALWYQHWARSTDNNDYDDDVDDGGGFRQHKSHSDIFTWELEVSNNPWVDKIMNSDKISELGQIYSGQA